MNTVDSTKVDTCVVCGHDVEDTWGRVECSNRGCITSENNDIDPRWDSDELDAYLEACPPTFRKVVENRRV